MSDYKEEFEAFRRFQDVLTGSLVAGYKLSHDEKYNAEYIRRLTCIGFTEPQAHNMFMFELMILKHDRVQALADKDYIRCAVIDPQEVPLPQADSWYVEHQMFLLSEIVKIWDEAEYRWRVTRSSIREPHVLQRIYSITRYGGGDLFVSYLKMMADKTHTDEALINAYARAEHEMLCIFRWKGAAAHPYAPEEPKTKTITIKGAGRDKISAIKTLREITGGKMSLTEASEIFAGKFPYMIPYLFSAEDAARFTARFEEAGYPVQIDEVTVQTRRSPSYSLEFIKNAENRAPEKKSGGYTSYHDSFLKKWRLRIQLDPLGIWFLSVFVKEDGAFEKYSLDRELAEDSHYEFVDEEAVRKSIYAKGDENLSFADILIRYIDRNGGEKLLNAVTPYVTASFHYD